MELDWRNEEDYEYTKDLSPEGWAWEFLRRNKSYRDSHKEFENEIDKNIYIPPRLNNETTSSWIGRCWENGLEPRVSPTEKWYSDKWGLDGRMPSPDTLFSDAIKFIRELTLIDTKVLKNLDKYSEYFDGEIYPTNMNKGKILIGFDLTQPLKLQLTEANTFLSQSKSQVVQCLKIRQKAIYGITLNSKYLRILDASYCSVSAKKIAENLFHNETGDTEQKAKDTLYIARQWAKNYKNVILLAKK